MWSRRSAIERCPSPWNRKRLCPIVTVYRLVKGNDILLKQILCSEKQNSINIIALRWPVNCYYWALTYLVSRGRASLDRRSTTPHVFIFAIFGPILCQCDQNWILRWVYEAKFFDTTNRLAATNFSVLAAKRLVVSKNFTSQTPIKFGL